MIPFMQRRGAIWRGCYEIANIKIFTGVVRNCGIRIKIKKIFFN